MTYEYGDSVRLTEDRIEEVSDHLDIVFLKGTVGIVVGNSRFLSCYKVQTGNYILHLHTSKIESTKKG